MTVQGRAGSSGQGVYIRVKFDLSKPVAAIRRSGLLASARGNDGRRKV
jgi:hypothetical protein